MQSLLFNIDMIRALMENRKTETRRGRGLKEINETPDNWESFETREMTNGPHFLMEFNGDILDLSESIESRLLPGTKRLWIKCPYKLGPAWCRETWVYVPASQESNGNYLMTSGYYDYAANYTEPGRGCWKPSIHMPFIAARNFIHIDEIRLERIQEITPASAIAEGIECVGEVGGVKQWRDYFNRNPDKSAGGWPVISFQSLITSINGPSMWERNEWVWRIVFHRIDKP